VKALGDALQWLFDAVRIWLQCVVKPMTMLNAILPEVTDENHLSEAAKVWVPSLLISLIISFPVLKFYDIEWNNVGYHLSAWMPMIIALVVYTFIVHQILLGLKLKSEFVRTLVIYTVLLATYFPAISLLDIPTTLSMFAAAQDFKQHHIPIDAAVVAYIGNSAEPTSIILGGVSGIAEILSAVFLIGVLALFAESVSQWYNNDRFKCYSAVAASTILSAIVFQVVTIMQFLIIYAFLGIAPG
jgi:hypothetical protein